MIDKCWSGNNVPDILNGLVKIGIDGLGVLPSAQEVARHHLKICHEDGEKAIDSVIQRQTAFAASSGFIMGLGGLGTLPFTIPASLASSYALGANTAAAIAQIQGYNLQSSQVQMLIFVSLLGDSGKEVLKDTGIQIGQKLTQELIQKIPTKVLKNVNEKIGFRLVTKAGEKGVINLTKLVPILGGTMGAVFDGTFVWCCGQTAKSLFSSTKPHPT